jgi:hypothetical protein
MVKKDGLPQQDYSPAVLSRFHEFIENNTTSAAAFSQDYKEYLRDRLNGDRKLKNVIH